MYQVFLEAFGWLPLGVVVGDCLHAEPGVTLDDLYGAGVEGRMHDMQRVLRETGAAQVMVARDFVANPRVLVSDASRGGEHSSGEQGCATTPRPLPSPEILEVCFDVPYLPPTHESLQLHFKWMLRRCVLAVHWIGRYRSDTEWTSTFITENLLW